MKKRMFTALVHNQNGILTRLMGIFTKHQYQIESLAVAVYPELKEVSKMSVVLEVEDDHRFLQLLKQVNKQIDVLYVSDSPDDHAINRELVYIKKLLI
ncbi:acetolactate synthase small subunit [Mesobacillus subterraneus]|uniref:Acetolactate synthase small subunit n=1 Tax=Mesobacillus subterraneus TaxID=285983 RepID=A0A3R9E922_9BACI|nr:acetolactate synthase small subunit [Mesobacillus subterraneus]RSD24851.1 acetolactate synthase small subunit [Mesobacillus subterraneus]